MKYKSNKNNKRKILFVRPPDSCPFGGDPSKIDYKDISLLKKYVSTRGRIFPSSRTGVSSKCQRKLALSIKRSRYLALMPFTQYV